MIKQKRLKYSGPVVGMSQERFNFGKGNVDSHSA